MSVPGPHAMAVLAVTLVTFYLYTRPWVRIELVSLLLLLALVLLFHFFPLNAAGGLIDDTRILAGFGHPVLVAILSLMILGRGLLMTGALEPAVRLLTRLWKWSPHAGLLLTLIFSFVASAFINDTPVLVMMLPMLLGIAERTKTSATKTLMPINFAILSGGMTTTLGTSTNLLVISIAADLGVRRFGIFDFSAISLVALLAALPYLWLIAPRLLPAGKIGSVARPRLYEARVRVLGESTLKGRTAAQLGRTLGRTFPIMRVIRSDRSLDPDAELPFQEGDELLIAETPAGLREIASTFSIELFNRDGPGRFVELDGKRDEQGVAELVIGAKSPQCGKTLSETRFAQEFGVVVIALHRSDEDLLRYASKVGDIALLAGDLLLVQGPEQKLEALRGHWDLMMLDSRMTVPRTPLARWALVIMASVVALASLQLLPIHIAALLGVAAMLLMGCIGFDSMGRALSLQVVLLVVASIALGLSLVGSGAADWLVTAVVPLVASLPPSIQVAAIMTMSAVLTNFVSNSAAAAIGTPIAVTVARQLGSPPEPFVLAILFGANLSYATPMAYQTNMLIMSAAGYTFRDFVRVGLPLLLLMLVTLSYLLARHYAL